MKESLIKKLEQLQERAQEVERLLSDPEVMNDINRYRDLGKEYAHLEPIVKAYKSFHENELAIASTEELQQLETDPEMQRMAADELGHLHQQKETLEHEIISLLLPKDPNDERNVFLEIRAGTGGLEAALFAGDLFRMYSRYAEIKGWQIGVISEHEGDQGGYKEVIARVGGRGAYSQLKFESGTHRVQRVPTTEAQGRIHTSACTVAVLPEAEEIDSIDINPADLRIDTFRASGAGGQHVNKTDSAIRITHLPTGLVVECQDERSQHKNRSRALSLLQSKLLSQEREKQEKERAETRRTMVGSGDRSERIRTYNFPQGRVTDHRINLTLYKLEDIIEGHLEDLIEPLTRELQAAQLLELGEE